MLKKGLSSSVITSLFLLVYNDRIVLEDALIPAAKCVCWSYVYGMFNLLLPKLPNFNKILIFSYTLSNIDSKRITPHLLLIQSTPS